MYRLEGLRYTVYYSFDHPLDIGVICPIRFAIHQLNYNLQNDTTAAVHVISCYVTYLAFIDRWDILITSLSSSMSTDLQHLSYVL